MVAEAVKEASVGAGRVAANMGGNGPPRKVQVERLISAVLARELSK